jgi:hypothetical protein
VIETDFVMWMVDMGVPHSGAVATERALENAGGRCMRPELLLRYVNCHWARKLVPIQRQLEELDGLLSLYKEAANNRERSLMALSSKPQEEAAAADKATPVL